jgi:ribosomal protein S27E
MPIAVQCGCGKRMGLSETLAGKAVKCPACGERIMVPAGGAATAPGGRRPVAKKPAGKIIGVVSLVVVIALGATFYFGPVSVWHQWEDVGPKAQSQIEDVLEFSLKAYLSQQGMYNPAKDRQGPSVDAEDIHFFRPTLVMSMPESVTFFGKSNQGDFKGHYHPATGEIDADVAFGGMTFGGEVTLAKSIGQFHITGREKDGQPSAEVNGVPLKIVYPSSGDQ